MQLQATLELLGSNHFFFCLSLAVQTPKLLLHQINTLSSNRWISSLVLTLISCTPRKNGWWLLSAWKTIFVNLAVTLAPRSLSKSMPEDKRRRFINNYGLPQLSIKVRLKQFSATGSNCSINPLSAPGPKFSGRRKSNPTAERLLTNMKKVKLSTQRFQFNNCPLLYN